MTEFAAEISEEVCECLGVNARSYAVTHPCFDKSLEKRSETIKNSYDPSLGITYVEQGESLGGTVADLAILKLIADCDRYYYLYKHVLDSMRALKVYEGLPIESIDLLLEGGETADLLYQKADYHFHQGNYLETEEAVLQALAIDPNHKSSQFLLAKAYQAMGHEEKAQPYLERLLELKSMNDIEILIAMNKRAIAEKAK